MEDLTNTLPEEDMNVHAGEEIEEVVIAVGGLISQEAQGSSPTGAADANAQHYYKTVVSA